MPISARLLGEDEEVLVDVHPHSIFLAFPLLSTVLAVGVAVAVTTEYSKAPVGVAWALGVLVLVPAAWFAARLVRWLSTSLVVTTTRILLRRGVFRRDVGQLRLARVTEIHTSQTLFERLIGSGRVIFDVSGDEASVVVPDVRRPRALQRVIGARLEVMRTAGAPAGGLSDDHRDNLEVTGAPRDPAQYDQRTPPHGVAVSAAVPWSATRGDPPTAPSIHQQLLDLDDLRQRGIVTEQEFVVKKSDLLRRM